MRLCQISETAISIGSTYFRLQLFELVFVSINSIFIGLEKAKGNSRLILFLNLLILGLKIALTALFVYVFKVEDIAYIELATIISQVLLSIIGLILIFKKSNILKVSLSDLKPKASYMKDILILSIPIFFGKFVMNIGKVSVNALCGYYYNVSTFDLIGSARQTTSTSPEISIAAPEDLVLVKIIFFSNCSLLSSFGISPLNTPILPASSG